MLLQTKHCSDEALLHGGHRSDLQVRWELFAACGEPTELIYVTDMEAFHGGVIHSIETESSAKVIPSPM